MVINANAYLASIDLSTGSSIMPKLVVYMSYPLGHKSYFDRIKSNIFLSSAQYSDNKFRYT